MSVTLDRLCFDSGDWCSLWVTCVLVAVIGVVSLSLCLFLGAVRGSMVLHAQLLKAVLRAPMLFFDTTPLVSGSNPPMAVRLSETRYFGLRPLVL